MFNQEKEQSFFRVVDSLEFVDFLNCIGIIGFNICFKQNPFSVCFINITN